MCFPLLSALQGVIRRCLIDAFNGSRRRGITSLAYSMDSLESKERINLPCASHYHCQCRLGSCHSYASALRRGRFDLASHGPITWRPSFFAIILLTRPNKKHFDIGISDGTDKRVLYSPRSVHIGLHCTQNPIGRGQRPQCVSLLRSLLAASKWGTSDRSLLWHVHVRSRLALIKQSPRSAVDIVHLVSGQALVHH